jgi:hypothetical protein
VVTVLPGVKVCLLAEFIWEQRLALTEFSRGVSLFRDSVYFMAYRSFCGDEFFYPENEYIQIFIGSEFIGYICNSTLWRDLAIFRTCLGVDFTVAYLKLYRISQRQTDSLVKFTRRRGFTAKILRVDACSRSSSVNIDS